ncbi:hypothetical protein ACTXT7_003941 [Hymenolepis weldensis]
MVREEAKMANLGVIQPSLNLTLCHGSDAQNNRLHKPKPTYLRSNGLLATFHIDIKQNRKYMNLQINRNQVRLQSDAALGSYGNHWASLSPIIACGVSIKQTRKLGCSVIYWDISITTATQVVDSQLDFDWLGQLDLLDLLINAI